MAEDEVLRMVAKLRDDVTGPMSRIEKALLGFGKKGAQQSKTLKDNWRLVHDQFRKVADVAKTGVAPALEAIGLSSLSAVGAIATLTASLKNFADQGTDVAAFGRKVRLTTDTIRGLEGVAEKFHVDPTAIQQGMSNFADQMYMIRRRRGDLYAHLLAQRRDIAQELAATPETVEGNEQALKSFFKLIDDIKRPGSHGEPTAREFAKEVFGTDAFVDLLRRGNAGLEDAVRLTLKLRGNMDTQAGEQWLSNWSDFKATIEGVRNEVGNSLLPDLTALSAQARDFFAENKVEIGREIVGTVKALGAGLREVNTGVQFIGGWKTVFEGLIALKLISLAANVTKVAIALGRLTRLGTPAAWILRLLGVSATSALGLTGALAGTVLLSSTAAAGESDAAEKARRDAEIAKSGGAANAAGAAGAGAIIQGLRDRGLDAEHAAILGGNIERESNFDPTKPNVAEGGVGLIQWRLDRRAALDRLAQSRHKLETDASTQLDFLMQELQDTPAGRAFLASRSPDEMNRALHGFIRYGDDSEGLRLSYGQSLLPLAEKSKPGSLLAAAGGAGMSGWAGTVTGSASIDVNVTAPKGTTVKADANGLFDQIKVNRGLAMPLTGEND